MFLRGGWLEAALYLAVQEACQGRNDIELRANLALEFASVEAESRTSEIGELGIRQLRIPTVGDRIIQTAAALALTPHVDPHMSETSFAYRPGRSVAMAVDAVREGLADGQLWVVDGDIARFFDTVPHNQLLATLGQWISDARFIELVTVWLRGFSPDGCGLAQGSPLSPLLSNLYLDTIDRRISANQNVLWVRYADDFVLLCPDRRCAERAQRAVTHALAEHGLRLNQAKTRIASLGSGFSFLGHDFQMIAEARPNRLVDGRKLQPVRGAQP